jgi:hypothetical protein
MLGAEEFQVVLNFPNFALGVEMLDRSLHMTACHRPQDGVLCNLELLNRSVADGRIVERTTIVHNWSEECFEGEQEGLL